MLRIKLLGGFQISIGARTIEEDAWKLRKAANLVKLLALAPGHRLHREQVMEALWPELGIKAASNNLRGALYSARKVLLEPTAGFRYLASQDESLVLRPQGDLWVDVEVFWSLLWRCCSRGRQSQHEVPPRSRRASLTPNLPS